MAWAESSGSETLSIDTPNGPMPVYLYRPNSDAKSLPVVIVLHGVKRNGAQARDQWRAAADRYGFLIIAPEFSDRRYPGAKGFMLGNLWPDPSGSALNPPSLWSYAQLEPLFSQLRHLGVTRREDYLLYGHSAGCQFVHRMLMAQPKVRAKAVVCASAGWWTPPDSQTQWPYGLAGAPFTLDHRRLADLFARPTLIMVGQRDTRTQHTAMRKTAEAEAQGSNRLQRGMWYYQKVRHIAQQKELPFHWQWASVPGAGHQSPKIVDRAAEFFNHF